MQSMVFCDVVLPTHVRGLLFAKNEEEDHRNRILRFALDCTAALGRAMNADAFTPPKTPTVMVEICFTTCT